MIRNARHALDQTVSGEALHGIWHHINDRLPVLSRQILDHLRSNRLDHGVAPFPIQSVGNPGSAAQESFDAQLGLVGGEGQAVRGDVDGRGEFQWGGRTQIVGQFHH